MMTHDVRFTIGPVERTRVSALLFGPKPSWQPIAFFGIGAMYAALGAADFLIRPGQHRLLGLFYVSLALFWMLFATFSERFRPGVATDGSLELSEAGLAGTLDGVPVTVAWSQIAQVSDLGDALIIVRRQLRAKRIVIPWSSIADPAAFWQTCEDHLIAKRGLVRNAQAAGKRPMIVNTAW